MKKARLAAVACAVLAGIVAVLIVLCILWFFQGSLESFPTPEQIEKVRISSGAVLAVLGILEGALIAVSVMLFRKK